MNLPVRCFEFCTMSNSFCIYNKEESRMTNLNRKQELFRTPLEYPLSKCDKKHNSFSAYNITQLLSLYKCLIFLTQAWAIQNCYVSLQHITEIWHMYFPRILRWVVKSENGHFTFVPWRLKIWNLKEQHSTCSTEGAKAQMGRTNGHQTSFVLGEAGISSGRYTPMLAENRLFWNQAPQFSSVHFIFVTIKLKTFVCL